MSDYIERELGRVQEEMQRLEEVLKRPRLFFSPRELNEAFFDLHGPLVKFLAKKGFSLSTYSLTLTGISFSVVPPSVPRKETDQGENPL